jgi:hypothetical protein
MKSGPNMEVVGRVIWRCREVEVGRIEVAAESKGEETAATCGE